MFTKLCMYIKRNKTVAFSLVSHKNKLIGFD